MKKRQDKYVIGWNERIDFPRWDVAGIKAKVDTGAKTSSLDVDHFEFLPDRSVKFNIVLSKGKKKKNRVQVITPITRVAQVKTSSHHFEKRVFVKTKVKLGPVTKTIEINLYNRSNLKYRMILGRSALKKDFLIDVSRSQIQTGRKSKKKKRRR